MSVSAPRWCPVSDADWAAILAEAKPYVPRDDAIARAQIGECVRVFVQWQRRGPGAAKQLKKQRQLYAKVRKGASAGISAFEELAKIARLFKAPGAGDPLTDLKRISRDAEQMIQSCTKLLHEPHPEVGWFYGRLMDIWKYEFGGTLGTSVNVQSGPLVRYTSAVLRHALRQPQGNDAIRSTLRRVKKKWHSK